MEDSAQIAQQDIALTYEKLYELLRREKNHEELQKLDLAFFTQLVSYLAEKDRSHTDSTIKNDIFSMGERQRLSTELHNIHRLVKELYERREKKVLEMALNRSRTNASIVDTTNLLAEERALFDQLVGTLDLFRNGVLANLLSLREPRLAAYTPSAVAAPPDFSQNLGSHEAAVKAEHLAQKRVRFLQPVPQVLGPEMETYGPFNPNDTAALPKEIADIWIEQGAAVENS